MTSIDLSAIMKNLGTFAHAYGLEPDSRKLTEDIRNGEAQVLRVGILLRDPVTKKNLVTCDFPAEGDFTSRMLWAPIDERPVEAVPTYTREVKAYGGLKNTWKRLSVKSDDAELYLVEEEPVRLRVHSCLCKHGVIEKYFPADGYGFIRRNRRGIYFRKEWCSFEGIRAGEEVSFVPVISRRGLQARAVESIIVLS